MQVEEIERLAEWYGQGEEEPTFRACADGEEIPICSADIDERKSKARRGKARFLANCDWDPDCLISIECDGELIFVGHATAPRSDLGLPWFDVDLVGIWDQAHQQAMPQVSFADDAANMAKFITSSYAGIPAVANCTATTVERDWTTECVSVGKVVEELAAAGPFDFIVELSGTCEDPSWRLVICPPEPEVNLTYPGELCAAGTGEIGQGYTDICVLGKDGLRSDEQLPDAKRRRLKTVKLTGITDQSQLDYAARSILAGCSDQDGQCVGVIDPECDPPPLCAWATVDIADRDPVTREPVEHWGNFSGRKQVVQRRWTIEENGNKTVQVWLGQQAPPTLDELVGGLLTSANNT